MLPPDDQQKNAPGYEGYLTDRALSFVEVLSMTPAELIPDDAVIADWALRNKPEVDFRSWNQLSSKEQQIEARRMEIYAAMIANIDWNIGRLIQYLKDINAYENTLIIFMSDNGASASAWIPRDDSLIDNSLENMGYRNSYVTYVPRWAEVSATPLRLWKQTMAEGGVSVPLIVKLPGQLQPMPISRATITVKDLAPTFAEIAGIADPGSSYRGREVAPWTGRSILSLLQGNTDNVHDEMYVFADESDYEYYVREGKWKAVWMPQPAGNGKWQLYDLSLDRGERNNLALKYPQQLERMQELYDQYANEVGVVRK